MRKLVIALAFIAFFQGSALHGAGYRLVAWNDLGMHCTDGVDYSVFGVLPPYNTVNSQLINAQGKLVLVPTGLTLTYEAVGQLMEVGLGQSTCVGIGGDPVNGMKHIDIMRMFNDDP